jgi:integrase
MFAAATGLRPSELFALEQGDLDRAVAVVQVRRAFANGRVKQTKTRLSRRAVPLQAIALEALDQLPLRDDSPLLFPNTRGGHLDFRNFNRRHWKPAQKSLGIEPLRDLYDLRHTYATFALRAGVPVFALSRFMGTSIAMIDLRYGHLAVDSTSMPCRSSTRSRSSGPWTLGGRRRAGPQNRTATRFPGLAEGVPSGRWTLGGRRDPKRLRPDPTEEPD